MFFISARFDSSLASEARSQVWTSAEWPTTIFTLFVCKAPMKCHSASGSASAFSCSSWA